MVKDPTILQDAISAWKADQQHQQEVTNRQAIAANRPQIYNAMDPSVGPAKANVTVIEFYDPRCPYCRQVDPMLSLWQQHDPDLRIVYKDLPILGPPSVIGSQAALAAERQGAYMPFRAALMASPPNIDSAMVHRISDELGLNWTKLQKDMNDPAIAQRLADNEQLAQKLGIQGTPGFVVGDQLVVGSSLTDVQAAADAARKSAKQ
ncbi:DsbA family protein [Acidisoma cellulosilytica]|uniref:DsbA family protein n=2 Tax=Acidisoma cellulosilyticum TaxID=2802395 RepID=A0A963Z262_9PROT|nr:DsbA family protein [Acidisoma cellulosilyticum]